MKSPIVHAFTLAVGFSLANPSFAQQTIQTGAAPANLSEVTPAEGVSNDTVDDAKIRSFVEALAAVQIVGKHYMSRIDGEEDGSKRAELIDLANNDIVRAIETVKNITPAEYVAIDRALQTDEALNTRILAALDAAAEEAAQNQEVLQQQIEDAERAQDAEE